MTAHKPPPHKNAPTESQREAPSLPVFAYGSNMHFGDLQLWAERRGRGVSIQRYCPALLRDYRLVFNYWSMTRGAGAANVQPLAEATTCDYAPPVACVPGLLLWVDKATLEALDHKEGHPQVYRRHVLPVETPPGSQAVPLARAISQPAWVYVVEPSHTAPEFIAPSTYYLSLIRAAARQYQFAADYQAWLDSLPTANDRPQPL